MIGDIFTKVSPVIVVGCLLGVVLLTQVFIRTRYQYRFRRAGGVSAPKLANDPIRGMS
jgi:hypothetical protein